MSSSRRWVLGDDTNGDQSNETPVGANKPLLQANEIPTKTPFLRMVSSEYQIHKIRGCTKRGLIMAVNWKRDRELAPGGYTSHCM